MEKPYSLSNLSMLGACLLQFQETPKTGDWCEWRDERLAWFDKKTATLTDSELNTLMAELYDILSTSDDPIHRLFAGCFGGPF